MAKRQEWRRRLDALVADVSGWVEPEWAAKPYPKKLRDADGEIYEVPALFIQKGPIRLLLDPIAYDAPGSEGVVDLYLMPTYDDAASLHLVDGQWRIHYVFDDGSDAPEGKRTEVLELSEVTLNKVLDAIANHAVPSF